MIKNKIDDTDYLIVINNLNKSNKVASPNKEIVKNIRLVYDILSRKIIDYQEAIGMIHEIIGHYSKGDYPSMSYSNSNKTKRKSRGKT